VRPQIKTLSVRVGACAQTREDSRFSAEEAGHLRDVRRILCHGKPGIPVRRMVCIIAIDVASNRTMNVAIIAKVSMIPQTLLCLRTTCIM